MPGGGVCCASHHWSFSCFSVIFSYFTLEQKEKRLRQRLESCVEQKLKQTLRPTDPQTLRPSDPQTHRPSDPQWVLGSSGLSVSVLVTVRTLCSLHSPLLLLLCVLQSQLVSVVCKLLGSVHQLHSLILSPGQSVPTFPQSHVHPLDHVGHRAS